MQNYFTLHYSSSTLYHHINDKVEVSKLKIENDILKEEIKELFEESGHRLSVKKMYHLLKSKDYVYSEKRVSGLMKELNLKCIRSKKSKTTSNNTPTIFPTLNKLKQNFNQERPNIF